MILAVANQIRVYQLLPLAYAKHGEEYVKHLFTLSTAEQTQESVTDEDVSIEIFK
jgi:hypothetical protein